MKTIEQNNETIAVFMNYIDNGCSEEGFLIHPITNFDIDISELKYHTSWDWLMSVVEKIEDLRYNGKEISFRISKYAVCLQSLDEDGVVVDDCIFSKWATYGGTEKLRATYDTCVQFIEWYNRN